MKYQLTKGKTVFKLGKVDFDVQDIFILIVIMSVAFLIALFTGTSGLGGSAIIGSIVYRNVLKAKGRIK